MYPWYRDTQIGVGQFCGPVSATIKTESGFNDCMLTFDYATSTGSHNNNNNNKVSTISIFLTFESPHSYSSWFRQFFVLSEMYNERSNSEKN